MAEDLEAAANQNEGKGSRGRRRRRRERKIRNRIISELPSYAKKQEEKEDGEADSSSSDDSDEEENEGIEHFFANFDSQLHGSLLKHRWLGNPYYEPNP